MFAKAVSALRVVPATAVLLGGLVLGGFLVWAGREGLPLWELLLFRPFGNDEPWRLVSPIFLHFGWAHAAFNALILWLLGGAIERCRGGWRLMALALVTGIAGNVLQYQLSGSVLFGGMSGVNYALLGYCLTWNYMREPAIDLLPGLALQLLVFLLICLTGVLELLFGLRVANGAHVGGLLSGAIIGLLDALSVSQRGR